MTTTKIYIRPVLAEYLIGKYYDDELGAVHLPKNDDLAEVVRNLTTKRPVNAPVDRGNVELVLPESSMGKRPTTWNYLSSRAIKVIERKVETRMWAEVHDWLDEQKHRYGIEYIVSIEAWMGRYNIRSISEDAIVKNYYRWRHKIKRVEKKRGYKKSDI
ncbi:MAG: hypothetical protein SPI35_05960 [Porphyromonas sp.]|nr:hypothetical protein [Porphyromonas sp.]